MGFLERARLAKKQEQIQSTQSILQTQKTNEDLNTIMVENQVAKNIRLEDQKSRQAVSIVTSN